MSFRAVFLDRDGVLNAAIVREGKPFPPARLDEVVILGGVRVALDELKRAGFRLIVVTNQPDVARGVQRREVVDAIHDLLTAELAVDAVYCCFHDDSDGCTCRKPAPGLLLQAAHDWDLELPTSFLVGDRWRDMEAGAAAGCRTAFVDYGYAEQQPRSFDTKVSSLAEAAAWILANPTQGEVT